VRALVFLLEFATVLAVAFLVYLGATALFRGGRAPSRAARPWQPGGRWQPRHYADGGHTVVAVARTLPGGEVVEEHVVARIPDSDEDWSSKFLLAKEEAAERAFHLNADG
jgi:hypothetical protein